MKLSHGLLLLSCCLPCLGVIAAESAVPPPEAKLTIKVMDEDSQPLAGMPVHVWLSESAVRDGQSDTNGIFVAEGTCTIKDIPISVVKQGYYDSRLTYSYPNYLSVKDHRWQPWNPVVTAIVRRIANPIPLYARKVYAKLPEEDALLGYDLVKGDWTPPHGTGQYSDFVVMFSRRMTSDTDYEGSLRLSFSNPLDGVLENHEVISSSAFTLPRSAPQTEYPTNWTYRIGQNPTNGYFGPRGLGEGKSYFLRVRSVQDENGKLKEALYGKIIGQIRIAGVARTTGSDIVFTYYLNPTPNDRNLEFDPKRNLFANLRSTEQVTAP